MIIIKDSEHLNSELEKEKAVMLYFTATWCGPCRKTTPILEELSEEYKDQDFAILKIDVDQNSDLSRDFGIRSIPSIFFLSKEDIKHKVEPSRFSGIRTKIGLESEIKNII